MEVFFKRRTDATIAVGITRFSKDGNRTYGDHQITKFKTS